MEDFDGVIIFVIVLILAGAIFMGVTGILKGSFGTKDQINMIDATDAMREQRIRMGNVREQQKRMMQDQKQRIKDMQRK